MSETMLSQPWFWLFNLVIAIFLAIDLLLFHKKAAVIRPKKALFLSLFWVAIALLFNLYVYLSLGKEAGLNFLSGYLIEKALSVDNLFVFAVIFSAFKIPPPYIHRVLFWGIFGAIVTRAVFILFGIAILEHFHSAIYVFGAFLFLTGVKLAFGKKESVDPKSSKLVQLFERVFPFTDRLHGESFFIQSGGKWLATPLFIALLTIEAVDVLFAIDSIPAILGITQDPFIVYTSNILAILGLRSLYFFLAHMMGLFQHLHYGLAAILIFIGAKMLASGFIDIPIYISLGAIVSILGLSILTSYLARTSR